MPLATIKAFKDSHWNRLWPIIEKVFREGETYPYPSDISEQQAYKNWIQAPRQTHVALGQDNAILGSYYIKPNQPGLGSHVCNCGYIVSDSARGMGIASQMCIHSQQTALQLGFKSMQYNLVVSTNEAAVHLWKKMGFQVIGVLPEAFNSQKYGYVDAFIMYKHLKP